MTPEAQRIAIAEACGIKPPFIVKHEGKWIGKKQTWTIPDYLNDLNAMHEAEKVLTDSNFGATTQRATYIQKLENVVFREAGKSGWSWALTHATSAQRAEAFLKTVERLR